MEAKDAEVKNDKQPESEGSTSSHFIEVDTKGLLMTAVVYARDKFSNLIPVRVFVDGGSMAAFISEKCVNRLGLRRHFKDIKVKGFCGVNVGKAKGAVRATLQSRFNDQNALDFNLLVMPSLGPEMPSFKCKKEGWDHLRGLELADPYWYQPGPVDVVIGVQLLHKVLMYARRELEDEEAPVAWESIFGWLVSGTCVPDNEVSVHHVMTVDPVVEVLKRFWEIEETPFTVKELTKEEETCEQHFIDHQARDDSGRFVIAVPFTEKKKELGKTREVAVKRLLQVERKLQRNPEFKQQYTDFMREYERLGHMVKVPFSDPKEVVGKTAHLPHHGVINQSSSTTKMRVVFDGSASSSTGVSLNETMLVGATVQEELYNLLLRFRVFPIVLKADIAKMFRQFRLRDEDADFHRIVWREDPNQPICDFKLMTVTYGTASAPFLATRCLHQLALECSEKYPSASNVLLNNTYVDDILGGEVSKEKAISLFHELTEAVSSAGMELRKWSSNDPEVLAVIPESMRETDPLSFEDDHTVKALGVQWHPSTDSFKFKGVEFRYTDRITKRQLLSDASRVFDPLGLISCVSVRAKMLLQEVWKVDCGWDDIVPEHVEKQFTDYKKDLQKLIELSIPRRITSPAASYEVHGFCDSSERAFGCILYLRCIAENEEITIKFITSKTRVTPVKLVSLPRLELESALMLAKLVQRVMECLKLECPVYLWSDSTITLNWIAGSPHKWKTYVGNRVAKVQRMTRVDWWRHVPGVQNPADLASRGATADDLLNSKFWWEGPSWLSRPGLPRFQPMIIEESDADLEARDTQVRVNIASVSTDLLERISSLLRLKRVTAYILRFFQRRKCNQENRSIPSGPLTASELHEALLLWIRIVQQEAFSEEFSSLKKDGKVNSKSRLKDLDPHIDNTGILRGRLKNASMPEQQKHQIILPADSHLTYLLVRNAHLLLLHGGFQLTWSRLQREYWILRGRDKVRHFLRKCVMCRRYKAKAASQMMGNLPSPQVEPSRPFLHTGVDYAGPFVLKNPVGRVPKTYKGYMCLFVCMATKAIHLEPVSSLTTEGFLEALRRFVSRRGICAHIYSDCGTNFVGADRELREHIKSQEENRKIADDLSGKGVQWHFNPPLAPHQGGLWEAGVKSAKHHIRRVIGNDYLTYEQFHTVLCQVEAVLNSRPLYAMSMDPADLEVLTPGHFIIGEPLTAVPDPSLETIASNRLNQYQRQQQRIQHFWQRWSAEYLNTLQQRNKWMWKSDNVKCGDLVLLKEDSSPGTWKLGRIVETHPGDDGLVRVATVKTVSGLIKRPIAKLIPLLSSEESK